VAGNDLIALGALAVICARGRSCPRDVSVVGYNDMPFADRFRPPLTTVHVPHHEMGAQGAQLLLERLRDPGSPARTVLLPARLTVRGSTAPVR
jgi:LacI family transcriptional regulator